MVRSFLLGTGFLAIAATAAASPAFIPIPDLPGGYYNPNFLNNGSALSADGRFAAGQGQSANGYEAYRYDLTTGDLLGVGDVPGGSYYSWATDISDDGSVIVGFSSSGNSGGAYVWTEQNGIEHLGALPGYETSQSVGVSGDGSTVVGTSTYETDRPYQRHQEAFAWDAASGMRGLGHLPGAGLESVAFAASQDGSRIVGRSDSSAGGNRAFLWTETTGMQSLSDMAGDALFAARDISADGSVIVGATATVTGSAEEAFRYTVGGELELLGFLPGSSSSDATSVSPDGRFVVGRSGGDAFVYDDVHGMRAVNLILEALGIDLTGWELETALGVSADGRVIVGNATNPDGQNQGYIAIIPEPSTAALMSLGMVALAWQRRTSTSGLMAGSRSERCKPPTG